MKKILIADDHQLFLDGLKLIFESLPEYEIVAEAKSGTEVLSYLTKHPIDIAIIDINMPKPNGFEVCQHIQQHYPNCKTIIVSMYGEQQFVEKFFQSGAQAYVLKNAGKQELLNAISKVESGEQYLSSGLKGFKLQAEQEDDGFLKSLQLTKREIEIIRLLVEEKSSQEIADQLFLSVFTVNTHRKNIAQKLGIKNTVGLVRFALDNKLL